MGFCLNRIFPIYTYKCRQKHFGWIPLRFLLYTDAGIKRTLSLSVGPFLFKSESNSTDMLKIPVGEASRKLSPDGVSQRHSLIQSLLPLWILLHIIIKKVVFTVRFCSVYTDVFFVDKVPVQGHVYNKSLNYLYVYIYCHFFFTLSLSLSLWWYMQISQ